VISKLEATVLELQRKNADQADKLVAAQGFRNQLHQAQARAAETDSIAAQLSTVQQELQDAQAVIVRLQERVKDDEQHYTRITTQLQADVAAARSVLAAQEVRIVSNKLRWCKHTSSNCSTGQFTHLAFNGRVFNDSDQLMLSYP
jgi:hypothetical protein